MQLLEAYKQELAEKGGSGIKDILDDEIFQDIKDELFYPKNLDRLFKGIDDINNFVKDFEILLHKYNNIDTLTGRDCFEVSLEEFGDR